MKKFAFIGAGSLQFTSSCIRDLLTFPAFEECEFALMDINPNNLKSITKVVERIIEKMGKNMCKITPTLSREEALKGADGVLCTVFNGDIDIWQYDILIPQKYGININIGDTRSVSGIFRALRNIPLMLDICRDIEKYCPNAVFLNYNQSYDYAVRRNAKILQRESYWALSQRSGNGKNAFRMAQCAF